MSYKAGRINPGQQAIPARVWNDNFDETERLGKMAGGDGIDISQSAAGVAFGIRPPDQLMPAIVAEDGIPAATALGVSSGYVYLVKADTTVKQIGTDLVRVYNLTSRDFEYLDEVVLYKWQEQLWLTPGSVQEGGGASPGSADRCACPEETYEVSVNCGGCFAAYGYDVMPKIWLLRVNSIAINPYYAGDDCAACLSMRTGIDIEMRNVPDGEGNATCVWTGRYCGFRFELSAGADTWILTITHATETCVNIVLVMDADAFACCGTNSDWLQSESDPYDPNDSCIVDLSIRPHPCTCCPSYACDPYTTVICRQTDCCLRSCNISVTVSSMSTPPPVPCTQFGDPCYTIDGDDCPFPVGDPGRLGCWSFIPSPEQSCTGLNGVYLMHWIDDCTWDFYGTPSSQSEVYGPIRARLTLNETTWTLRLWGPDGQVAVFRNSVPWDCTETVISLDLVLDESTCQVGGTASFLVEVF